MPIRYQNIPIGVITLGSLERIIDVSEDDVRMIESICSFIGTTIKNTELYTELGERKKQIEEFSLQVMSSIEYAARIQRTLLPAADGLNRLFSDHFIIWLPRDIVGGDLYFLEPIRRGKTTRFLVGIIDCTGHGVPGAMMTMLACAGLKKIIHDQKCCKPDEILRRLNLQIKESLRPDSAHAEADEGLDASICLIEKGRTGRYRLTFSGARQSLVLIRNDNLTIIKGDKTSIGYRRTDPAFEFSAHTLKVEKGMHFYIYSDGYASQFGEKQDRPLGSRRLIRLLKENSKKPFACQRESIIDFFYDYQGKNAIQDDDVTIIGFALE